VTGSSTTLSRVTIAENQAAVNGGGILADGVMTLENVTISGNVAVSQGGGIFSDASLTLNNVTLDGNRARSTAQGPAILVNTGTTRGSNTAIGPHQRFAFAPGDQQVLTCRAIAGSLTSLGHNVRDPAEVASCFFGDPGDSGGTISFGPLQLNGGQTRTHALLSPGSNAAVDRGDPATPLDGSNGRCGATDQRGQPRPVDGNRDSRSRCDAGAFEVQPNEGGGGGGGAGAFSVQASTHQAQPGQPVVLSFGWTVPSPEVWRDLDRLDLRLLDERGQPVFILRWTETGDRYVLLDASGRELAAGMPGSATVLTTPFLSLALRDVKTQGSGPTGQAVTLTLPLVFTQAADDQRFTVQVAGRADSGAEDPFATATTIQVGDPGRVVPSPPNDDGKDEQPERSRKETDEQRQQRERGNAAGQDQYRTEGNVVEVHLDQKPPYLIIGTRDGQVRLNLRGDAARMTVKVGDYVTAEGEKISEQRYEIDDLEIE